MLSVFGMQRENYNEELFVDNDNDDKCTSVSSTQTIDD